MGDLLLDIAETMVKMGAFRLGTFQLSSGKMSPYYIDLRSIPSLPSVFRRFVEAYEIVLERIEGEGRVVEVIAGLPITGLPYAAVLAHRKEKPLIWVREAEKEHGIKRRVDGILEPGSRVLLLDDIATTGNTVLKAARAIRAEGGVVEDVMVLIDRLEGAKMALAKEGIRLNAFTTIRELCKVLRTIDAITDEQLEAIERQMEE